MKKAGGELTEKCEAAPPAEVAPKKKQKKTAGDFKAKKPSVPSLFELILKGVTTFAERKGVSLLGLKKALSIGGYDVDKNQSQVKESPKKVKKSAATKSPKKTKAAPAKKVAKNPAKEPKSAKKSPAKVVKPKTAKPKAAKPKKSALHTKALLRANTESRREYVHTQHVMPQLSTVNNTIYS
ncbi:hypothetical protein NDU88_004183 [Pleurodeles waltl]|uniref:H15 domain-containing protein n=1 Tax=Pleurodeles waltl TaxID=8319 RepID=A0AAV7V0I3_PLEWA|nr:hypothetical protein NDU88_004183 [Pleurodeles waltl]